MELNDLIFLGACALFGDVEGNTASEQSVLAVKQAKRIWLETLKQDRDENE